MASSHLPKGRGRGRAARQLGQQVGSLSDVVPAPAISQPTDVDTSSTIDDVQTSFETMTTSQGTGRGSALKRQAEIRLWKVSDLSSVQFKSNSRPSKPLESGTIGEPIIVKANYFPVTEFPQDGIVYQYDIEIRNKSNRLIRRDHRRAVYNIWLESFREKYPGIDPHKIVFDSQKLIFTFGQQLPDINETGIREKISGPNRLYRMQEYDVCVKLVGEPIDLSFLRAIKDISQTQSDDNIKLNDLQSTKQMLSIVLHEYCSSNADFIFNRSFFSRSLAVDRYGSWDLGLGKAMWRGFYSCLVFAKGAHQLLMNLDISYRVFMKKQRFLDFLCEIMLQSPSGKWRYGRQRKIAKVELTDVVEFLDENVNGGYYNGEIEYLLEHCKGLTVRSQVLNKKIGYIIDGFGKAATTQTFFWKQKGIDITVQNYFNEQHTQKLEYPTLPTLKMRNGSFVPMEFIYVEPSRVTRITDEQRAMLCLKSSMSPSDCYKSIQEIREKPKQQCFEDDPFIAAWNTNVRKDMLTIPARILPMPTIICNDRYTHRHRHSEKRGVWNQTRTEFYKPTAFPSVWALINLSASMNEEMCKRFYDELKPVATDRGIKCPEPVLYEEYAVQNKSRDEIIDELKKMMEQNDECKFFIVILPENDQIRDRIYGDIKELCELESGFGIVTQMIKLKKNDGKQRWNYSRLNSILMKINTKLNGINSIVDIPDDIKKFFSRGHHTMYVGVDLSHGAAGSSRRHSTVAVVASVDDIPIRYLKEMYTQDRPPEIRRESWENVVDMKEIMKSLIRQYKDHHSHPPNAIVIYRDGISTSEFDTVFEKELMAIREACVELSVVYRPYLTYIVVNKRHHTRFFPTDSDNNIEAGTVVDSSDVTNPTTYDFFLNSHHVDKTKGTSRPTHYHVLYDDNKLTPDQVQLLTYNLCYLHARCSSSISMPAPVKYADLLAFRASRYSKINSESTTKSPTTESNIPTNQEVPVDTGIKSKRIVLSSKLEADCPFFL